MLAVRYQLLHRHPQHQKGVESSQFTSWIGDAGERTARDFFSVSRKYLGEHYRLSARLVGSVKVVRGAKLTILHAAAEQLSRQGRRPGEALKEIFKIALCGLQAPFLPSFLQSF